MLESCAASTAKAEATAKVIMAKKMARTLRAKRPMISASAMPAATAATMPARSAVQVAPQLVMASATP